MNKELRKAISYRSHLRNVANKTNDPNYILKYKTQRNYVKKLNNNIQVNYYKHLDPKKLEMSNTFFANFKPLFSSKYTPSEKMLLIENGNIISDDEIISNIVNEHFTTITNELDIEK